MSGGRDEAGTTLAETTVAMAVLAVFLLVVATLVLGLVSAEGRVTQSSDAQEATRHAFEVLDKQIRYADAVTTPAVVSGAQWIEWRTPDRTLSATLSPSRSRCYQWRVTLATGLLQYRSWVVPPTGDPAVVTAWATLARGLDTGGAPVFTVGAAALGSAPFLLPAGAAGTSLQQVGVLLSVTGAAPARSSTVSVFTAMNTSAAGGEPVCTEVARS